MWGPIPLLEPLQGRFNRRFDIFGSHNMVETRVAQRFRVRKPATVEHWGLKVGCTVCDISITGAALEFAEPIRALRIPDKFKLVIPEDALNLLCRVVWRRDYRMGVTFED